MSGNISLVEQAGLWLALAFFLRAVTSSSPSLLVLVSGIKFAPLFFSRPPVVRRPPSENGLLLRAGPAFTAIQVVFYAAWPLFHDS